MVTDMPMCATMDLRPTRLKPVARSNKERVMLHPVVLTVVPQEAALVPGDELFLALIARNTGSNTVRLHLDIRGVPQTWYTLDQPRVTLGPGASEQMHLAVHPPASPPPPSGRYTLTIRLRGGSRPAIGASTDVALTIGREGELHLDVQPTHAVGRAATFRLTYRNLSPAPAALALRAEASEQGLRFRPEPAEPVIVPAGGSGSITVHVVPRVRETVGAPRDYGIVFRALQLGTMVEDNPSLVGQVRFTCVPRITIPALHALPAPLRRLPLWAFPLPLLLPLLLFLAHDRMMAHTVKPIDKPATTVTPGGPTPPGPTILLNPVTVRFDAQKVGTTSREQIVHVVNLGPVPLTVTSIAIRGADTGDFAANDTCTHTGISVNGGCTISVRFTPLAAGRRGARLEMADNAAGSPRTVPLVGFGSH